MTQEQAKYLLTLAKEFTKPNVVVDLREEKIRWDLVSPDDDEWKFMVQITNNKKKTFKISLHHQEETTNEGLLRIDFNSGHKNPEQVNEFVPDFIRKYSGYWFINEPHIHLYVESYKNLVWAIPLSDYTDFTVKNVTSTNDYTDAILEFSRSINLISKFAIQQIIV